MASNTKNLPEWLTDEAIAVMKKDLEKCSNPYTQEEVEALPLDGTRDMRRYNAHVAKEILTKYGIIEKD